MPDHRTARPSDGGYRDRTGDLLLAKARKRGHQGAPQGTKPPLAGAAAAAAATRTQTAPESLRETHPPTACIVCDGTGAAHGDYGDTSGAWCETCEGSGLDEASIQETDETCPFCIFLITASQTTCGMPDCEIDWDAQERHARALDRSEAAHHLRVRHHQAARAQAHVRTAVGW